MAECTATVHGTNTAYRHYGCRCDAARRAHLRAQKRWKLRVLREGPLLIDATGTVRRIQALRRLGWPLSELARELGYVSRQRVHQIGTQAQARVHRDIAARVIEVYDRLSMTPGPDIRARRRAERLGWPPPLAWDDETIDDPAARPYLPEPPKRRVGAPPRWDALALEDVRFLRSAGCSDEEIAARFGIATESLAKTLRRLGVAA